MDAILEALRQGKFTEDFNITHVDTVDGNMTESKKDKPAEGLPKSIMVTVEAIHAGMTKNRTFYPADKLESSVHTWTSPYNKPVIKNHNTWEEPNGRVMDAYFKDSVLVPEGKTIELKLKITDPDTIEKVLDGRYQTLSIGGSTSEARCSICAKNVVESGWCGHSRGKKYEGKEAYWIIGEMEFVEISWVNVPADVNARVVSIQKEANSAGGRNESVEDTNLIDDVLNENAQNPEGDDTPPAGNVTEDTNPEGQDNPETPVTTNENEDTKTDAEKLAEALAKVAELEESVTTVTGERDALQAEKDTFESTKQELETTIAENTQEITLLKEERDNFRDKNIKLAKTAHRYLAERAVDLRISLGEAEKDGRDNLISEYAKTPASVLESTIKDLLDKPMPSVQTRESTPVTNPGGTNTTASQTIDENGDITESTNGDGKPAEKSFEDLVETAIQFLSRP